MPTRHTLQMTLTEQIKYTVNHSVNVNKNIIKSTFCKKLFLRALA